MYVDEALALYVPYVQGLFDEEQIDELAAFTHKSLLPVSRLIWKICGGVPSVILAMKLVTYSGELAQGLDWRLVVDNKVHTSLSSVSLTTPFVFLPASRVPNDTTDGCGS